MSLERKERLNIVEKLKKILEDDGATVVCDALRKMGYEVEKLATSKIFPVNDLKKPVVGLAVTIKNIPSRNRNTPQEIRDLVFTPIDESGPGDLIVIESGVEEIYSQMGGLMALAIKMRNAEGAIIDGGCRDVTYMNKIDLPVFATGTCLFGPGNFTKTVACKVPVTIGGMEVNPNDLLVADRDGIIVVPPDAIGEELINNIQNVIDNEVHAEEELKAGKTLREYYPIDK